MNTNVKTVCGALTANSDFNVYTISMLIYNWADDYHTKIKNSNEMSNYCFTMYIFTTDMLTYLPLPIK